MQKLTLPKSGQAMTEGTVVEWHVDVGESVSEGDPVLEFETDKMISEITADQDGILLEKRVDEGETVDVGTVLGYVGAEGETPPDAAAVEAEPATESPATASSDTDEAKPEAGAAGGPTPAIQKISTDEPAAVESEGPTTATPSARRTAREHSVDVEAVAAALDIDRVTPGDVDRYVTGESGDTAPVTEPSPDLAGEEILGTPWARVVAEENDVTIPEVGTALGKNRIRERDIHEYLQQAPETEELPTPVEEVETDRTVREDIEISGGQQVMFDQMSHVAKNYASTTTVARVDVTDLLELYDDLKETWVEEQGDSLSLTAFVARAVSQTLPEYPRLNAEYLEDENTLRTYEDVNLGLAVNSDDGLIVPTIYDTDQQSVRELSRSIETVATKVEERRLEPKDLENATFSISNAGNLGAFMNTPQIDPPQTAILGICKIFDAAGVVDGAVEPRKQMHLCLTYDHRVVEGATAVKFLQTVKSRLESPSSLLS